MEYKEAISFCRRMEERCPLIQIRSMCLSAHLDSFCRRLDELSGLEFIYQTDDPGAMRRRVGWDVSAAYKNGPMTVESYSRALECDVLVEMLRELDLMETRAIAGKATVYVSERWLKPLVIRGFRLPAIFRLLSPRYLTMVRRFVRLMDCDRFYVFPCGVHAVYDFVRLYRLMHGDLRCLFRAPDVNVDRHLCGVVEGFRRMRLWGYFVASSKHSSKINRTRGNVLKLLWVGRMLNWKRVDVLIKAFKIVCTKRAAALLIIGEGPEKDALLSLAGSLSLNKLGWEEGKICFNGYVQSVKARELMRDADVYVMPSNSEEGWGAAVSDALTEGCPVISTWEAGSSATLLPESNLYHSKDVNGLAKLLVEFHGQRVVYSSKEWSGENAAEKLMEVVRC